MDRQVERDAFAKSVLNARMHEWRLPSVPIYDDVTTFHPGNHAECRGALGLTGGFPCQVLCLHGAYTVSHWLEVRVYQI